MVRVRYVAIGLVLLLACVFLIPVVMTFTGSLISAEGSAGGRRIFPQQPTLENYVTVFQYPIVRWFLNSTFVVGGRVIGSLAIATMAAFAVAKYSGRAGRLAVAAIVITIMTPGVVLMVPKFVVAHRLGMYDSYAGLIVPGLFSAGACWFLVKFIRAIPDDMVATGRLDGLGAFGLLRHVIVPMAAPALAALGVLAYASGMQDFLWPLLMTRSPDKYVLPLGVKLVMYLEWMHVFRGADTPRAKNPGILLAGAVIALVPSLAVFLAAQKYFIGGLFHKSTGGE